MGITVETVLTEDLKKKSNYSLTYSLTDNLKARDASASKETDFFRRASLMQLWRVLTFLVLVFLSFVCSYICQHLIKMCFMLFLAGRFSEAGSARCSLVEAQLLDAFRPGTTCNPIGLEAFSKERDFDPNSTTLLTPS